MDRNESLNHCIGYGGQERREHCELVVELRAAFLEDKKHRDEWRDEINQKLEKVVEFIRKIEGPYQAGLWAFRIGFGAVIISIVGWVLYMYKVHLK